MFTQDQWNQAIQDTQVRKSAYSAISLLIDRESPDIDSSIVNWAIGEVLGETLLSQVEYYATFFLVLNPWMLDRPRLGEIALTDQGVAENRHPRSGKSLNDVVDYCDRRLKATEDEELRTIWGNLAISVNSWPNVQAWAAQVADVIKYTRTVALQGSTRKAQAYHCYREVYQYATGDTLPTLGKDGLQ